MRLGSKGTVSKQSINIQVKIIHKTEKRRLNVKPMLTVFLGCQGFVQYEFGHRGLERVNKEFYLTIFLCIKGSVQNKWQDFGGKTASFFIVTTLLNTHHSLTRSFSWKKESTENCALLGDYTASGDNFFPTFQDNLSVPSSRIKNPKRKLAVPIWSLYREECGQW